MIFNSVVLFNIYYHLDIPSLYNCSLVNKQFNKLFNSDILWEKLIGDSYSNCYVDLVKRTYGVEQLKIVYKITRDLYTMKQMANLTRSLEDIIKLKKIYLQDRRITGVPTEIYTLINLNELHISYNHITEFSQVLCNMVNLEYLYIDNNYITEIPREIKQLVNLKILCLDGNQISRIPRELCELPRIEILHLHHNRLCGIPDKQINYVHNMCYIREITY